MNNHSNMYKCVTPVTIIIFNRVDETRNLLEAISLVKPIKLYVVSDGPRIGNEDDIIKVNKCRELIDQLVNWECLIIKIYSNSNLV